MSELLPLVAGAAFVGGLAGGAHCAGMCGGIVAMLCRSASTASGPARWRYLFAYNAGRIGSYACAGAIAGALGQAGPLTRAAPWLQPTLFAMASIMLVAMGLYVAGYLPAMPRLEAGGAWLWRRIEPATALLLPVTSMRRALGLGALWGWLPCGMVYVVLLSALATGNWWQGAVVLLAFGLGTAPALFGIGLLWRQIERLRKASLPRLAAGATVAAFGLYSLLLAVQPHVAHEALLCTALPTSGWLSGAP